MSIETEDFGAVLVHLGDRARGAYTVSQVNAGCKNRFQMEIYGTKCGVQWNQERPDELWIGHRNSPTRARVQTHPSPMQGGTVILRASWDPSRKGFGEGWAGLAEGSEKRE